MAKVMSSRGHLCSSFLLRNQPVPQTSTLPQFVEQLTASETRYAGFNMLLFAPKRTHRSLTDSAEDYAVEYDVSMVSNGGAGNPIHAIPIVERSGGISNDSMTGIDPFTCSKNSDTEWIKVAQGRALFSTILSQSESENEDTLIERLFDMLRTKIPSPPRTRQDFQETIMVDPVDMPALRRESSFAQTSYSSGEIRRESETSHEAAAQSHEISSVGKGPFNIDVSAPAVPMYYATRLSSVLLMRKDGRTMFVERDVWINDKDDMPVLVDQEQHQGRHERRYHFQIS